MPCIGTPPRRKHKRGRKPHGRAKSEHFFKIILESVIEKQTLMLPPLFASQRWDELDDIVSLNVHDQRNWEVGLTKQNKNIWFDDGWNDFMQHYSILSGYLLMFQYNGNSNFSVRIFDKTGCDVPCTGDPKFIRERQRLGKTMLHGGIGMDITSFKCFSSASVTADKPSSEVKIPRSRGSTSKASARKRDKVLKPTKLPPVRGASDNSRSAKSSGGASSQKCRTSSRSNSSTKKQFSVICRKEAHESIAASCARMCSPKNPSFLVVVEPNENHNGACIPTKFVQQYMKNIASTIRIFIAGGQEWHVGLSRENGEELFLHRGWSVFASDNNITFGDACLFELISSKDISFKASILYSSIDDTPDTVNEGVITNIFKIKSTRCMVEDSIIDVEKSDESGNARLPKFGSKRKNTSVQNCEDELTSQLLKDAGSKILLPITHSTFSYDVISVNFVKNCNIKYPSFLVSMKLSNIKSIMFIPSRFSQEYLVGTCGYWMIQTCDGKEWHVLLKSYGKVYMNFYLVDGWPKFVQENNICISDLCLFELMPLKNVLKVSILHSSDMLVSATCLIEPPALNIEPEACEGCMIDHGSQQAKPLLDHNLCKTSTENYSIEAMDNKVTLHIDGRAVDIFVLKRRSINDTFPFDFVKQCGPKHPSFLIDLRSAWATMKQYIPMGFSLKYLGMVNHATNAKIQASDGRVWDVYIRPLRLVQPSELFITRGWKSFFADNNLTRDDLCLFELISSANIVLKASIYYASRNNLLETAVDEKKLAKKSGCSTSKRCSSTAFSTDLFVAAQSKRRKSEPGGTRKEKSHDTNEGKNRETTFNGVMCMQGKFKDNFPFDFVTQCNPKLPSFLVDLLSSWSRYKVYIPANFTQKYLREVQNNTEARVQASNGRDWSVNIVRNYRSATSIEIMLMAGWYRFFSDNDLTHDDLCLFELVSVETTVVLKATICRANGGPSMEAS